MPHAPHAINTHMGQMAYELANSIHTHQLGTQMHYAHKLLQYKHGMRCAGPIGMQVCVALQRLVGGLRMSVLTLYHHRCWTKRGVKPGLLAHGARR